VLIQEASGNYRECRALLDILILAPAGLKNCHFLKATILDIYRGSGIYGKPDDTDDQSCHFRLSKQLLFYQQHVHVVMQMCQPHQALQWFT